MVIYLISYESHGNQTVKPDVFCSNESESGLTQLIARLLELLRAEKPPALEVRAYDLDTPLWGRCRVETTENFTVSLVRDSDGYVIAEFVY